MPPHSFYNHEQVSLDDCCMEHSYIQEAPAKALTSPKPKKSVSFHSIVRASKVLHINNYTDEEIEATWYSDSDYAMMKADNRYTAQLFVSGMVQGDDDQYCRRGLESYTPDGSRRRKSNRAAATAAVLDEQDEQFDEGVFEPEYIAQVYKFESEHCQVLANTIALADQEAAQL